MFRKIFFIIIFLNFCLLICPAKEDLAEDTGAEDTIYPTSEYGLFKEKRFISNGIYLSLDEVCSFALSNNFDIQLAQFDAQFKEADLDKARSVYDVFIEAEANFNDDRRKSSSVFSGTKTETRNYKLGISQKLPTGTTLGVDFDNQRLWTNSGYTSVNPAHDSSVKLSLKQELGRNFFGIKDRSNIKITKIDIQNARYTSLDKIEQMLSTVQNVYWRIAHYLNIVKIRQDMLIQASELFKINQEKIHKGIIERPQLIASEANLRQKEIDLILAQNEFAFHINELKFLLNLDDEDKIILPKDDLVLSEQLKGLDESLEVAFQHRRDYLKAKNEVDSKEIKLVMERNNLWPEINLESSAARNGLREHFSQAMKDVSSEDNPEYFFGLSIEFPLQNREARSGFNKAKIEKAKALIGLKKIERKILVDIKDSVRNCNILQQRAQKQENVVKLQEEKLIEELKRYKYGRSDTDTVIRYQDDLLSSKLLYTQALLDYKQALIELSLKENSLLDKYWKDTL
jgi:outer membrane protein TolC